MSSSPAEAFSEVYDTNVYLSNLDEERDQQEPKAQGIYLQELQAESIDQNLKVHVSSKLEKRGSQN